MRIGCLLLWKASEFLGMHRGTVSSSEMLGLHKDLWLFAVLRNQFVADKGEMTAVRRPVWNIEASRASQ